MAKTTNMFLAKRQLVHTTYLDKMFSKRCGVLVLVLLLCYTGVKPALAILKITKVDCRTIEPSLLNITKCVLKPLRRDVTALSITAKPVKPVKDLKVHTELLRKYNTYQPFLYRGNHDICAYLKYHKNYKILDMLFALLKPYINLNHTCPFEHDLILERLVLRHEALTLPWPSGDYLLKSDWYVSKKLCARIHVWGMLRELEHWQKPENNKLYNNNHK